MNTKKLNRELNFLLSTNLLPLDVRYLYTQFSEFKDRKLDVAKQVLSGKQYPKRYKQSCENFIRIFEIADMLHLTESELLQKWDSLTEKRERLIKEIKKKPISEGRDNKGVYVGSGGANKNMVRYPSKKRSKRVWKIFYKMFPRLAEKDGWDGEMSNKMK
jgi:hypothetical protein